MLLQQAKTILESSSEYDIPSQGDKGVVDTNDDQVRPGLGRKRARFSLQPNASQPIVSLEPNLGVNKLKDPEELFMAYERHENSKREMQKQMGGTSVDSNQQNPSTKPRERRPGILGFNRRPVAYKHFHSSMLSDGNEALVSSIETLEQDILSPIERFNQGVSGPEIVSQSQELDGSISKAENRTDDGFLGELLSNSCEDLDGDGAFALLQEHLQIKPIVFEKLSLPDLQNVRRTDPKGFDGKSPKPRKVLVDVQNLLGGASFKFPAKYKKEGSPTPSRSSFGSLLALKMCTMNQSGPLGDRYSVSVVDASPARNASPVDRGVERSDRNDALKDMCIPTEMESFRIVEDDCTVAEPSSSEVTTGNSPDRNEKSGDEFHLYNSCELKSLRTEKDGNIVVELCSPKIITDDSPDQNGKSRKDDSSRIHFSNYIGSRRLNHPENRIGSNGFNERVVNENLSRPDADVDFRTDEVNAFQDNVQVGDVPEAGAPAVEEPNRTEDHSDQSSIAVVEDHTIAGPQKSVDIVVEHQLKKNQEQSKSKLLPEKGHKRMHPSQMQNLDGAGTKWDGGVRRSTRFRTRPLEYWKGERLLYGRIHNSMSTVIGMKYVSPGKSDGNPTIKVKQIVSDEYNELVDLAAWH